MKQQELSLEQKKAISSRLGVDLAGSALLAVGLFWAWLQPQQALIGMCVQATAALLVGGHVLFRGIRDLFNPNPLQYSDQLVAIAVLAAASSGDFLTATLVPLALDLGRLFEERTAQGAQMAIENIRALQAERATRIVNNEAQTVPVTDLSVGDLLLIRAGERIAADGIVRAGKSSVDQSAMTGESIPEKVTVDSPVYAGSTNIDGVLQVEVEALNEQTAIGRIISLLGAAEASKTPIIRQLEHWLAMYMPVALALAGTVLFFTEEIDRAVTILIVAFPTSLAIAGSSTMVAAFSKAAQWSLLIKDASLFQKVYQADVVVFDKTGTLTESQQTVSQILPLEDVTPEELLNKAALCAKLSLHPISQAVTSYADTKGIETPLLTGQEFSGKGVCVTQDAGTIRLGRLSWLEESGVSTPAQRPAGVGAWVAEEERLLGFIGVEDPLRADAAQVVHALKKSGFEQTILLTGDRSPEAERVAQAVGMQRVFSEKLPEEKLCIVEELKRAGHCVLMIGDGVNDALALQKADVGIALGASLNRAAAGGADAALLSTQLDRICHLVALADQVQRTIVQNIVLGVAFSAVMLSLASLGVITPIVAAVLHNIGAILVIVNSSRILVEGQGDDTIGLLPEPALMGDE